MTDESDWKIGERVEAICLGFDASGSVHQELREVATVVMVYPDGRALASIDLGLREELGGDEVIVQRRPVHLMTNRP